MSCEEIEDVKVKEIYARKRQFSISTNMIRIDSLHKGLCKYLISKDLTAGNLNDF